MRIIKKRARLGSAMVRENLPSCTIPMPVAGDSSAELLCGSRKRVSNPPHGLDQAGLLGVPFDLFSQPRDEIVDRPIEPRPIVALAQVHDVVSRKDAVRPFH